MKIAILGWGSLLWEGGAEFDKRHDSWSVNGPTLNIEFSRISQKRLGALTLVLDNDQGSSTQVAWCLSKRAKLDEALSDLRKREDTTIDQIGHIVVSKEVKPKANKSTLSSIET